MGVEMIDVVHTVFSTTLLFERASRKCVMSCEWIPVVGTRPHSHSAAQAISSPGPGKSLIYATC